MLCSVHCAMLRYEFAISGTRFSLVNQTAHSFPTVHMNSGEHVDIVISICVESWIDMSGTFLHYLSDTLFSLFFPGMYVCRLSMLSSI